MNISEKPPFAIFLDIDGVLYRNLFDGSAIRKAKELFPKEKKYTNYLCSIGASHLFDRRSVQNLNEIIDKIEKLFNVVIIISSNWREGRTVAQLRDTIFKVHKFSNYIVDKTSEGVYGSRYKEIRAWLDEHSKIQKFIILDDWDGGLSKEFPEQFFRTNVEELLSDEITADILRKTLGIDRSVGTDRKSPTKEMAINS